MSDEPVTGEGAVPPSTSLADGAGPTSPAGRGESASSEPPSTEPPPSRETQLSTTPPNDDSGAASSEHVENAGEDSEQPAAGWGTYAYISALQLSYVFVLYVLSTGPMYWSIYEAYTFGGSPFVQKLYRPLVWMAERSTWFSGFLDWWIGLWVL